MGPGNIAFLNVRDPISAASHALAFLVSVAVTVLLWRLERGRRRRQVGFLIFGLCMTVLYLASAVYHTVQVPEAELRYYRLLDHSAIYLLIAGTNTPLIEALVPTHRARVAFLASMWSFALAGIVCKWLFPVLPEALVALPYIVLGWIGAAAVPHFQRVVGWGALSDLVLGGVAYTAGAIFDWQRWPELYTRVFGPHELFHLFVVLGSVFHVKFMLAHVVGQGRLE